MATQTIRPDLRRSLFALLVVFVSVNVMACGGASVMPSSPSAVAPAVLLDPPAPGTQADAARVPAPTQTAPSFAECLRRSEPSCLQPLSRDRDRAADGGAGATNLVATVNGATVTLTWSPPAGLTVIDNMIDVRLVAGGSYLANYSVGVRSTYTASDVPAGTYYVSVRAQRPDGYYATASNEVTVTVTSGAPCAIPGAPGALRASVDGNTIVLSWNEASGSPLSYVLDVGSSPGGSDLRSGLVVGNVTSISARDQPAGTSYVRVRASNGCGTGPASNEVAVTVAGAGPGTCTTAPGAPSGLQAASAVSPDGVGNTITLSWTAPSGSPAAYLLDAGSGPGLSDITSGREVGVQTTMSAPNQPGGTYYLRIRAKNNCGTGPASNEVSLTVGGSPGPPGAHCTVAPGAPSGLRASVAGSTIILSWTAPSGLPTSYLLDAGSAPGLSDIASNREVGVEVTMSAPNQPNGTYYLRVRGANNCGIGPASNEVSVTVGSGAPAPGPGPTPGPPGSPPGTCTTAPGAPSGLGASVSGTTITLSWTAPSGSPASYLLDSGSAPGLSDIASGREVGVETTISTPNQPGGTYYVRIRAKNNCGTGPPSNEVSVTVAGGPPSR